MVLQNPVEASDLHGSGCNGEEEIDGCSKHVGATIFFPPKRIGGKIFFPICLVLTRMRRLWISGYRTEPLNQLEALGP